MSAVQVPQDFMAVMANLL